MSKSIAILLVVVEYILLIVANLSLWITRDVLDSGRFGMLLTEGLESCQSAEALRGSERCLPNITLKIWTRCLRSLKVRPLQNGHLTNVSVSNRF